MKNAIVIFVVTVAAIVAANQLIKQAEKYSAKKKIKTAAGEPDATKSENN